MRITSWFALVVALLTGCDDDPVQPPATPEYSIEITNLTDGQPLTPPVVAIHNATLSLFQTGATASAEVREIAENGNLTPMIDLVTGSAAVSDFVVAEGDPPPLLPGESRTVMLMGEDGAAQLSVVAMLICTNDGFTGVSGRQLPSSVGSSVTVQANAYDAGTEQNTEAWEDIVPPCGPLTGQDSGGAGTGMSDPALAEGGVIQAHGGITGNANLSTDPHGWSDPVARIVITRVE